MPEPCQIEGHLEELAIYARFVGAGRVTLDQLDDDEAFAAVCKMGATVRQECAVTQGTVSRTDVAELRLHRIDIEVRRPVQQAPEPVEALLRIA